MREEELETSRNTNYEMFLECGKMAAIAAKVSSRLVLLGSEYANYGSILNLEWVKQALDDMVLPQGFKRR